MIAVSAKVLAACATGTLILATPVVVPKVRHAVKHRVANAARHVAQAIEPVPCIPVGAVPITTSDAPTALPVPERFLPEWSTEAPQPVPIGPPITYFPPDESEEWYPPVISPPEGGIPEPQSWVLITTGFFITGHALRRKNYTYAV